jgi:hypothetical protein
VDSFATLILLSFAMTDTHFLHPVVGGLAVVGIAAGLITWLLLRRRRNASTTGTAVNLSPGSEKNDHSPSFMYPGSVGPNGTPSPGPPPGSAGGLPPGAGGGAAPYAYSPVSSGGPTDYALADYDRRESSVPTYSSPDIYNQQQQPQGQTHTYGVQQGSHGDFHGLPEV